MWRHFNWLLIYFLQKIQSKEKEAFQKGLQQGQSETTNIKPSDSEVKSPNVGDEVILCLLLFRLECKGIEET